MVPYDYPDLCPGDTRQHCSCFARPRRVSLNVGGSWRRPNEMGDGMKRSLTRRSISVLIVLSFVSLFVAACKGDDGSVGSVGPKGDTGPAGSSGASGGPGPQGPQGDTGSRGPEGASGAQGPQGDPAVATVASLTIGSSSVAVGEDFSLNGSGFTPGSAYTAMLLVSGQERSFIHVDSGPLVINNSGAFDSKWRYASTTPAGVYTLIVTDEQGGAATAPFVIS